MSKPTSTLKNQRFPHLLHALSVYLVMLFLTMGLCAPVCAQETNIEKSNLLYTLLVAELAASRNLPDIALNQYLDAAKRTSDPAVAEESTVLALSLEAPKEAILSAELWANKDPRNIQAQLIAVTLLISQSIEKALPYLTRALEYDPQNSEQPLLDIQERLSETSAKNLRQALDRIATQHPSDPYIHLIAAASAAEQRDMKNANLWVNSALKQMPDFTHAIELKARLIRHEKNSEIPALIYLDQQLEKFPQNHELRFFYISALLDDKKIEKAKIQLLKLTHDSVYAGPSFLILGEIAIQENQWATANQALTKALAFEDSKDGAEYLLGKLEEHRGQGSTALSHYAQVGKGPYHISAILRAVALLKASHDYEEAIYLMHNSSPSTHEEQKQLLLAELDLLNASKQSEEAMQLVNDILPKLPDDPDLLLMRAVTAIELKQWDVAKGDLQHILKQNPKHSQAQKLLGGLP